MPRVELSGLPIAITGASSGIGAATALACARAGMPVALGARRVDRLEALAEQIRAGGGRAIAVACDVNAPDDAARLVDETRRAFGSIYAVYANAGYGIESAVHETPLSRVREIFETNFFGTVRTIEAALPPLLAQGRGHVLMCSSCLARMTLPYYSAYSATKAAQHHLGRAMRMELESRGIFVSTVHPIGTRTEFFEKVKTERGGARLIEHTKERFLQPPEVVADATVRALRRPRAEVWTSAFVRLGMAFCAAFPGIEDRTLRAMVRKRLADAERAGHTQSQSQSQTQAQPGPAPGV